MSQHFETPVSYQPRFPRDFQAGIGIVGCGSIVRSAHLEAYRTYGLDIVGVYDVRPEATAGVREQYGVRHIFRELDELLAHPEVTVVDIATWPEQRVQVMHAALDAGKHVLAQKPVVPDMRAADRVRAMHANAGSLWQSIRTDVGRRHGASRLYW